jgi:hypothetical protein
MNTDKYSPTNRSPFVILREAKDLLPGNFQLQVLHFIQDDKL